MSFNKGVGFRPLLQPPEGRRLQRNYRPTLTCLSVSGCVAVLVCVVFGLTAFNIYEHRFGLTEHAYHAGDEMSLKLTSKDLSSVFCSAYNMQPLGRTDFYLLPSRAELDPTKTVDVNFTLTAGVGHVGYSHHAYYLNTNSTVSLSACRNHNVSMLDAHLRHDVDFPAEFLVIVGDNHYKEWRKFFNNRHVKYRRNIPVNATCHGPQPLPTLNVKVEEADDYYFLLMVHHNFHLVPHDGGTISLTGSLHKTQFKLSGAMSVCNASRASCQFPLDWGSDPDVVAKIRQDTAGSDKAVSFYTDCQERVVFWVGAFGVIPVVIMLLTSLLCWCLLVRNQSVRSRYRLPQTAGKESRKDYGTITVEDPGSSNAEAPSPPTPVEELPDSGEQCASIQS